MRQLLVIGGSAGSLDVLLRIMPGLPMCDTASVLIVLHRRNDYDSPLVELLATRTGWQVKEAEDKETIEPGTVYLAPADYHLLVEKDFSLSLDSSEKINFSRPSIDITFETAADAYGERLACLLLSGANADGVNGLIVAAKHGSTIAVQHPDSAVVPYMPQQALNEMQVQHILRIEEMAAFIRQFCSATP